MARKTLGPWHERPFGAFRRDWLSPFDGEAARVVYAPEKSQEPWLWMVWGRQDKNARTSGRASTCEAARQGADKELASLEGTPCAT